jgi:hypothetical protein
MHEFTRPKSSSEITELNLARMAILHNGACVPRGNGGGRHRFIDSYM